MDDKWAKTNTADNFKYGGQRSLLGSGLYEKWSEGYEEMKHEELRGSFKATRRASIKK